MVVSQILVKCPDKPIKPNELMNGLEAMHHVRFAGKTIVFRGIEKDPNCASCYLNLGYAEQDRVLRRDF